MHSPVATTMLMGVVFASMTAGCSSPKPTLKLEGDTTPPVFVFGGSGTELSFSVLGPFSDEAALKSLAPPRPIIFTLYANDPGLSVTQVKPFNYGLIPDGFTWKEFLPGATQPTPKQGSIPPLLSGKYYEAQLSVVSRGIGSTGTPTARVCFHVDGANTREVPCAPLPGPKK